MMDEVWTYRLEDFVLFGPETYWRLFALENTAVWPLQIGATVATWMLIVALVRNWSLPTRGTVLAMAVLWGWVGWHFVFERYSTINWAAKTFAWLFFAQAVLLVAIGLVSNFPSRLTRTPLAQRLAVTALAIATVVYPMLALVGGRPIVTAEVIGVAPDPTVTAILGLMVLFPRNWTTLALHAIPATWMGLSGLTLIGLGSWQGIFTLLLWGALFAAWLKASEPGRKV